MLRTHTCGELNSNNIGEEVILSGWVQRTRDFGGMTFLDLRDRYGITQLVFNMEWDAHLCEAARRLGREYVIRAKGKVTKRESINPKLPTGEIEIIVDAFEILNESKIPPFTIEDQTDGGEELRMKYRYLDLRRNPLKKNIEMRHALAMETRKYLSEHHFLEIETPYLIKSTPEGARDFIVPSRMNPGQFYALPQSPQTLKQILMIAGYDRYFQIVRCFRDEDLRADRQPEFTQIDCEMAFVEQEDILRVFEGLIVRLFSKVKGIDLGSFPKMSYNDAMRRFGSDKPDIRFGMEFTEITSLAKGKGFKIFDEAEIIVGIDAKGCANYSRKELDQLTEWVKKPQIGASGLIYIKFSEDGSLRSSIDKYFQQDELRELLQIFSAEPGDLILIMAGAKEKTLKALGELRLEMGNRLGLRNPNVYCPLWVVDFPLLEWDEDLQRFFAMHHPFTSPKPEDISLLETNPSAVRANAYDLVINGVEIGGGSIRIHRKDLQNRMLGLLGFTQEEAQKQFGFLMNAFEYGAPPHGGIAFGFDRLCAIFGGSDSIRDYIAFPKNNSGRDMMMDSPSEISQQQLDELYLKINFPK
ncbi:MAG TPA: aspartate--tRNA ligase [Bacteroidales bacterium]|nr:aspartate--tRNA ligase [Bacteroidales bacterium]